MEYYVGLDVSLKQTASHCPPLVRATLASGISLSEPTMSREMKALGYRKISARPRHHAQNEFVIEAFKSLSPA